MPSVMKDSTVPYQSVAAALRQNSLLICTTVRLFRLEHSGKDLLKGQTKIAAKGKIDRTLLKERLSESADAVARIIELAIQDGGKVKGFKRGVIPLLGYMISHEAHHRGNILLNLKLCGHKIPKEVQYGIWAWNQI